MTRRPRHTYNADAPQLTMPGVPSPTAQGCLFADAAPAPTTPAAYEREHAAAYRPAPQHPAETELLQLAPDEPPRCAPCPWSDAPGPCPGRGGFACALDTPDPEAEEGCPAVKGRQRCTLPAGHYAASGSRVGHEWEEHRYCRTCNQTGARCPMTDESYQRTRAELGPCAWRPEPDDDEDQDDDEADAWCPGCLTDHTPPWHDPEPLDPWRIIADTMHAGTIVATATASTPADAEKAARAAANGCAGGSTAAGSYQVTTRGLQIGASFAEALDAPPVLRWRTVAERIRANTTPERLAALIDAQHTYSAVATEEHPYPWHPHHETKEWTPYELARYDDERAAWHDEHMPRYSAAVDALRAACAIFLAEPNPADTGAMF